MRLVEADEAKRLYAALTDSIEQSGGGAANTAAIIAKLGGDVTFVGRVADDALGATVHPRHPPRRASLRSADRATELPVDGALHDPHLARRRAHDEHVPRRVRRC